jgi:hypothetical protein
MSLGLEVLEEAKLDAAAPFLAEHREAMLYHQPQWLRLLAEVTASSVCILAIRNRHGELTACAPVFVKDGPSGRVANSSPFFGSHGGILAADEPAFVAACSALVSYLGAQGVVAANIIEPLFTERSALYRRLLPVAAQDRRIGQFKDLQRLSDRGQLLESVSGLVRSNLRRRAWKSGIRISRDESAAGLSSLHELHLEEMGAKTGGKPKPRSFFDLVGKHLRPGSDWRLYFGELDGIRVAGLLVFLWREFTEYYIPVFRSDYREHQPASAVIFEAMLEAAAAGRRWWNFGGSWQTQPGVKTFKDSWGATNREYHYYVLDLGGLADLRASDRTALLKDYDGFYLYPFQ